MKRLEDLERIETAMNAFSRIGQSRRFAAMRAERAGVRLGAGG